MKNCERCNAGMPSFRVNPLCEECFAEEADEYATCDRCGVCLMDGCTCEFDVTGRSPGLSGD